MTKMKNKFQKICLAFTFLVALAVGASAQSMSGTVKNFDVKFRRGEKQTVKTGAASYAMSYVYNLNARKGQTITVKVESAEKDLTFSVTSPGDDTIKDAFSVKRWSGIAPETGKYSIVLVMNNERAKKVPFRLRIKVE